MKRLLILAALLATGIGAASNTNNFLIQRGKVGRLLVGMPVVGIWKIYPRELVSGGFVFPEGMREPVVEIRLSRTKKEPSIRVFLSETDDHRHTTAMGFEVFDPRFRTAAGLGPGSTIAQLRRSMSGLEIIEGEGETILISEAIRTTFALAVDETNEGSLVGADGLFKPIAELPGDIRIKSIWVH